jgi:hypothetical protein
LIAGSFKLFKDAAVHVGYVITMPFGMNRERGAMNNPSRFGRIAALNLLAALSVLIGCGTDKSCPTCPGGVISLGNIWPNRDSTYWVYEYSRRTWDQDLITYDNKSDVPSAPTLDDIERIIDVQPVGENVQVEDKYYRLEFDSLITTSAGVTAQNLKEMIAVGQGDLTGHQINGDAALMARLLMARPDLRGQILPNLRKTPATFLLPVEHLCEPYQSEDLHARGVDSTFIVLDLGPVLLHGGAWEKTSQWIGTYGDLEKRLAWKYLSFNLSAGSEFHYQLNPSVKSDVFMHVRIMGTVSLDTPVGIFENALECLYLVDYGVAALDNLGPAPLYARGIDFGTIAYAPDIGPVFSYERNLAWVGSDTLGVGYGDRSVILTETNLIED